MMMNIPESLSRKKWQKALNESIFHWKPLWKSLEGERNFIIENNLAIFKFNVGSGEH